MFNKFYMNTSIESFLLNKISNGLSGKLPMANVLAEACNAFYSTPAHDLQSLKQRNTKIKGFESGNFINPTIIENVNLKKEIINTEIFGPVMSLVSMKNLDDAIDFINNSNYGNMACIFTESGSNARKFRNKVYAGNIGVNIGVAAPMAQFPFSGWKDSFFGDLHGQGKHAIEFFTQTKVVIERWPNTWSRKF